MGTDNDIALSYSRGYYIPPPAMLYQCSCYIAGCYTATFEAKKGVSDAI